jgi:hypothetical protein
MFGQLQITDLRAGWLVSILQVLPVFIKALPLKEDHEESMTVYSCVCNLLLSSHPQVILDLYVCYCSIFVSKTKHFSVADPSPCA